MITYHKRFSKKLKVVRPKSCREGGKEKERQWLMFESSCRKLKWEKHLLEGKKSIVWQKKELGELVEKYKK